MSKRDYPTGEYLRECFRYEDGKLFWLHRPRSHFASDRGFRAFESQFAGNEAGCSVAEGQARWLRWNVRLCDRPEKRSRIVWAMFHNEWPFKVDHKNRDTLDDRIENLRPCTTSQNAQNSRKSRRNTSGYKGVSWSKSRNKYVAYITVGGNREILGGFSDAKSAHESYVSAAARLHGEFASV